jgi:hypothetical protein
LTGNSGTPSQEIFSSFGSPFRTRLVDPSKPEIAKSQLPPFAQRCSKQLHPQQSVSFAQLVGLASLGQRSAAGMQYLGGSPEHRENHFAMAQMVNDWKSAKRQPDEEHDWKNVSSQEPPEN